MNEISTTNDRPAPENLDGFRVDLYVQHGGAVKGPEDIEAITENTCHSQGLGAGLRYVAQPMRRVEASPSFFTGAGEGGAGTVVSFFVADWGRDTWQYLVVMAMAEDLADAMEGEVLLTVTEQDGLLISPVRS